jgi:hypothetical protein
VFLESVFFRAPLHAEIKDLKKAVYSLDVITMWHYLEHDYTPLENLTYLKSIAKPSTTLVIEIPNFDSMSRRKYGENPVGIHLVIFHYFLK